MSAALATLLTDLLQLAVQCSAASVYLYAEVKKFSGRVLLLQMFNYLSIYFLIFTNQLIQIVIIHWSLSYLSISKDRHSLKNFGNLSLR